MSTIACTLRTIKAIFCFFCCCLCLKKKHINITKKRILHVLPSLCLCVCVCVDNVTRVCALFCHRHSVAMTTFSTILSEQSCY